MAKQKLKQKELKEVNGGVAPYSIEKDNLHYVLNQKDDLSFRCVKKDDISITQLRKDDPAFGDLDAYLKPEEKKSFFNNILDIFKNIFIAKYKGT